MNLGYRKFGNKLPGHIGLVSLISGCLSGAIALVASSLPGSIALVVPHVAWVVSARGVVQESEPIVGFEDALRCLNTKDNDHHLIGIIVIGAEWDTNQR